MAFTFTSQGLLGSSSPWDSVGSFSAPTYPGAVSGGSFFSGNNRVTFSQAGSYTVPRVEGAGLNISPSVNFTTGQTLAFFQFGFERTELSGGAITSVETYANGGLVFAFRSGAGNWRRYKILGSEHTSRSDQPNRYRGVLTAVASDSFTLIDINSPGDYPDDGTFNPASVDRMEVLVSRITSSSYFVRLRASFMARNPILTGAPASFSEMANYFGNIGSPTITSPIFSAIADDLFYSFLPKIQIGTGAASVVFSGSFNLRFPEFRSGFPVLKKGIATSGLILRGHSSGSTITITNSSLDSIDPYVLDASSLQGSFSCNNLVVNGPCTASLNSVYNQINGGFFGCRQISLNGGTLRNLSISGSTDATSAILYRRTVGGVLTGIVLSGSTSSGLSIDLENGSADLSALVIEISNNTTRDILINNTGASTGTTYTLNISGLTSPAGNTTTAGNRIRVTDSTASNTYNITTNASYSQSNASSAGATVNILAPTPPVTVTAVNAAQNPIAGAAVYLETSPGAAVVLNGVTDSGGAITTSYSGSTPQAVVGWVRSGSGPIAYIDFPLGGNITSSGYNQTAILQEEP